MLDEHRFCPSQHWHPHDGLHASQIAQAVSLDRRTVASGLPPDHLRRRNPRPPARTRDPCQPAMVRLLARHPSSAAPLFQRLRAHGFTGSYELGKPSVRPVRPRRQPAFLTWAWAPGAGAQVAGGSGGSVPVGHTHRQRRFFVMVVC
jgi:hypothetical protein